MKWDWLIAIHKWLQAINIETRVSLVAALALAVALMAYASSHGRLKEWRTLTLRIVVALAASYALVRQLIQLKNHGDTVVVGLLLATAVGGFIATVHSIRHAKRLRALMSIVATMLAVSAACLISAQLYRNGPPAYFLGGGAESVNWLVAALLMFLVVPAGVMAGVLEAWKRWRRPQPA